MPAAPCASHQIQLSPPFTISEAGRGHTRCARRRIQRGRHAGAGFALGGGLANRVPAICVSQLSLSSATCKELHTSDAEEDAQGRVNVSLSSAVNSNNAPCGKGYRVDNVPDHRENTRSNHDD